MFYYPIEALRIAGDILRLIQAGLWNLGGGTPYMPDLHSDAGKSVPPQADKEASLQWMKQWQGWNLENGAWAVTGKAIGELGNATRNPCPKVTGVGKSCFPAGTPVATSEGLRPIETIGAGDLVWAYDLVASQWRLCRVKKPYNLPYHGTIVYTTVAGETIASTYRHPYWVVRGEELASRPWLEHLAFIPKEATTPGRWVDSSDLRVGDEVLLRDGRMVTVDRIAFGPFEGTVYNMQVEELQCYTVGKNGVLVHNNNSPATGPGGTRPPNMSPPGAGRSGAFNAAKRANGVPTSMEPTRVVPNLDRRGNLQPGRVYEFDIRDPITPA